MDHSRPVTGLLYLYLLITGEIYFIKIELSFTYTSVDIYRLTSNLLKELCHKENETISYYAFRNFVIS